jgi:aspartate racemase
MKTIGIFGGLGPESTAAYYEYITAQYYEMRHDYAYPEIVIYSVNFKDIHLRRAMTVRTR